MTLSVSDVKRIADLAYIEIDEDQAKETSFHILRTVSLASK